MGRIWYNIWRFFAAGAIQRQDSLTNENAMTLGASGLRRSLCSEVNPVSERNYSSYSSQDESRPRSRSSSGRRSSEPRRSKKRGKRSPGRTALWVISTILLVAVTTGAIMCCFAAVYIRNNILPQAQMDMNDFTLNENSIMYYQDDSGQYQELGQVLSDTSSEWVDFEEIPQDLKDAAVAIEDRRFYTHHGVDWWRTAQAVVSMFTGGDIQGGSTITQQTIKNLTKKNEVTVTRKVQEIFTALYVDETYGKDTVLLYYLNIIPLGAGCEGVGAAAQEYFGKSVSELSLAECASLIGITNNPPQYGPYSLARVANSEGEMWTAVQWNKYRQEIILHEMLDQGYITQEEHDQAVAEELHFVGVNAGETEDDSTETGEIYSWYEEAVISDVWEALKEEYDYSDQVVSLMLSKGGLRIYTCIDPDVQAQAEAIYEDESNLNYYSSSGQRLQSAITIIDNETGDIAAIVGRIGAKELNRGFNLATSAQRQPGSSIKPLTVYAPAVDMGLISPITVIPDYPYQVLGGSAWPVNVDGRYRGQVTVNAAVEDSFNTVAVRVLADLVTPAKGFEYGTQRFHLPLISEQTINGQTVSDIAIAPLSLGGLSLGVSTRDMATAFATFPNDGVYREARTFTRVEDADGNVILDNTREEEQAIKDTTAYYMNYMLTNVVSSGGGSEARISGMTVAGKTGTTDTKDNRWFVGYTPYYTAAVWVGFETPARVPAPGNPAAQMFQKVMAPIHDGLENTGFTQPSGLTQVSYCLDCGGEATTACQSDPREGRVATAYVFAEDRPSTVCTCHSLEEGSNSMVRVCVDDPVLDANGEFTGYYHLAGPNCPEVSIRTYSYLNLDRESVGGAVAEDSQYFYSAYVAAAGTEQCTVHGEGGQIIDPDDPNGVEDPNGDPGGSGDEPGTGDSGGDSSGSSSQPGTDDPGTPGSSSSSTTDPMGNNSEGGVAINPETGRPYGY